MDLDQTDVTELYARFALNDVFALTGDIQYIQDSQKQGEELDGWVFGVWATAEY